VEDAVGGADLTLLLTAWEDYAALDAAALAPLVRRPVVLDARGALDVEAWSSAGWDVEALGRRPRSGDRAGGGMAGAA
jgi:UDPglucose 6-dehydrogenase